MKKEVVKITESELKSIVKKIISNLNEDTPTSPNPRVMVTKTDDNNLLINNQFKYKLQVSSFLGWIGVSIDRVNIDNKNNIEITASAAGVSKRDIVPPDKVNYILQNLGKPVIPLTNEKNQVVKQLVKI